MEHPRFVFFGTPHLAVIVLEELSRANLLPALIVTAPDKPAGRGMKMQATPVKKWAQEHGIEVIAPETFDTEVTKKLTQVNADAFVVVAYGKILKDDVLAIPRVGTLNVHPSLLPHLRGPSPVRTAILNDDKVVGVTVMEIDAQMDHGPIVTQEVYEPPTWPPNAQELDNYLFARGGALLAEALPRYVSGNIALQEQDHSQATYSKLFKKEDGEINLNDDPYQNLLKIHAYAGWPGTYFYITKNGDRVRLKIIEARLTGDGRLVFERVVPEGRKEMSYVAFLQS